MFHHGDLLTDGSVFFLPLGSTIGLLTYFSIAPRTFSECICIYQRGMLFQVSRPSSSVTALDLFLVCSADNEE